MKNAQVILHLGVGQRFPETPLASCVAGPVAYCYSDVQDRFSLVMRKMFSQTFEIIGGFFFEVTVAFSDLIFFKPLREMNPL